MTGLVFLGKKGSVPFSPWGYRVDPYPDYYVDIYSDGVLLVMLAAGLSCIVAVMLRRHRLALFLLGLAAGAFVNRSFVEVFYNDVNVH
jgi:hypothetical protein